MQEENASRAWKRLACPDLLALIFKAPLNKVVTLTSFCVCAKDVGQKVIQRKNNNNNNNNYTLLSESDNPSGDGSQHR